MEEYINAGYKHRAWILKFSTGGLTQRSSYFFLLPTLETLCGSGTPGLQMRNPGTEDTYQHHFKPQNKKQNSHDPCGSQGHAQVITASWPFGTASHH